MLNVLKAVRKWNKSIKKFQSKSTLSSKNSLKVLMINLVAVRWTRKKSSVCLCVWHYGQLNVTLASSLNIKMLTNQIEQQKKAHFHALGVKKVSVIASPPQIISVLKYKMVCHQSSERYSNLTTRIAHVHLYTFHSHNICIP